MHHDISLLEQRAPDVGAAQLRLVDLHGVDFVAVLGNSRMRLPELVVGVAKPRKARSAGLSEQKAIKSI